MDTKEKKNPDIERLKLELRAKAEKAAEELAQLDKDYVNKENSLSAAYERDRRSFDEQANAKGLNLGAVIQARQTGLAEHRRSSGSLAAERAGAAEQGRRELRELQEGGRLKIDAAELKNRENEEKQRRYLDEKVYRKKLQQAQILARYGDFSLYSELLGPEAAENMRLIWQQKNPTLSPAEMMYSKSHGMEFQKRPAEKKHRYGF